MTRSAVVKSLAVALPLSLAGLVMARPSGGAEGDDRATAEALVKQAAPSPVTSEAIARANEALEQATRLRAAGDEAHAKAAEGLAREWAETARDLSLAVAAEKLAEDSKRQAMQSQAQLQRTRALVEESIARLGRLRAELDAASAAPASSAEAAKRRAVESHDGDPKPKPNAKAQAATEKAPGSTP
jgi:hypothetical protein